MFCRLVVTVCVSALCTYINTDCNIEDSVDVVISCHHDKVIVRVHLMNAEQCQVAAEQTDLCCRLLSCTLNVISYSALKLYTCLCSIIPFTVVDFFMLRDWQHTVAPVLHRSVRLSLTPT